MSHLSPLRSASTETYERPRRLSAATRHFIRHYVEMVIAMLGGMAVLGLPAGWALGAVGSSWSELTDTAPSLMFIGMAITMTAPMVVWMRYRGHAWRANAEMAASMLVPTGVAIALLLTGLVEDTDSLLVSEHIAMLLGMLGVMLARPAEYTQHHGHAAAAVEPQAAMP